MTFGANRCLTIKTKKEMKKNLFMVAAVALMALVSCNKEGINNDGVDQSNQPSVIVEFTASLAVDATRTTLSEGKTLWLESDEISINGEIFEVKELFNGGASAKFVNKNELSAEFAAPYTALYPANVSEVPSTQTAYEGTFDPTAVLETASSEDTHLSFKNVTSLLKFRVPAACSSVTLTSDDVLAGSDAKTVTISGNMVTGTDYYVAVLPGTKSNFKVSLYGKDARSADAVSIGNSTIVDMGTIPAPTLKLYVEDDTDYSTLYLYMYDASGNNVWPGTQISATETVNGVLYKVYTVPTDRIGKEYTYIFNNNKGAQVEENKKITFDQDNYLRLTKKYSEVVDASNKGKDDPITLYIRNDDNWPKLNYYMWIPNGATNASWPGKTADQSKKTKIEGQTYYYVEIGSHSYTRIIINNGSSQTSDMTIQSTTDDIYATSSGYCWKGADMSF